MLLNLRAIREDAIIFLDRDLVKSWIRFEFKFQNEMEISFDQIPVKSYSCSVHFPPFASVHLYR